MFCDKNTWTIFHKPISSLQIFRCPVRLLTSVTQHWCQPYCVSMSDDEDKNPYITPEDKCGLERVNVEMKAARTNIHSHTLSLTETHFVVSR